MTVPGQMPMQGVIAITTRNGQTVGMPVMQTIRVTVAVVTLLVLPVAVKLTVVAGLVELKMMGLLLPRPLLLRQRTAYIFK